MTIWKFPLQLTDTQKIPMPKDAQILSAQVQDGTLCIWALVDPDRPKEERKIEIHGTGNASVNLLPKTFIGTAQMGMFVWHVFESKA